MTSLDPIQVHCETAILLHAGRTGHPDPLERRGSSPVTGLNETIDRSRLAQLERVLDQSVSRLGSQALPNRLRRQRARYQEAAGPRPCRLKQRDSSDQSA